MGKITNSKIKELEKKIDNQEDEIKELKKRYRELALKLHPDRNMTDTTQTEQKFVKVNLAYETIMAAC